MNNKYARCLEIGKYIATTRCTVRDAAKYFRMGKSTVHKDVTEKLERADAELYKKVRAILDYNLSVRHLRGGEATKQKCEQKRRSRAVSETPHE